MKKLIFLLVSAVGVSFANAQKIPGKEVPEAVKSSMQKSYSNAKNVKWEKEKDNYEAGFTFNATDYSVLFDASGSIVETETGIAINALPAAVKDYLSKHYPKQKIKEAAKITDDKGIVTYEAEINGKDIILDESGKLLKEVKD